MDEAVTLSPQHRQRLDQVLAGFREKKMPLVSARIQSRLLFPENPTVAYRRFWKKVLATKESDHRVRAFIIELSFLDARLRQLPGCSDHDFKKGVVSASAKLEEVSKTLKKLRVGYTVGDILPRSPFFVATSSSAQASSFLHALAVKLKGTQPPTHKSRQGSRVAMSHGLDAAEAWRKWLAEMPSNDDIQNLFSLLWPKLKGEATHAAVEIWLGIVHLARRKVPGKKSNRGDPAGVAANELDAALRQVKR